MLLILRRSAERQAAFDEFVASQYDAKSPNFHHWLTPDEVGEKYGPAQTDIDTVSSWLLNHRFTVDEVSKNRLTIRFSGTASLVEAAFHTKMHNLQVKGENHIANMTDPQIPEALTPVVVGVEALHNFFPRPLHRLGSVVQRNSQTGKWERISTPAQGSSPVSTAPVTASKTIVAPQFGTGGTTSGAANIEDIGPYDFATIYNLLPVWNANIDGTGQKIAIVGTSDINPADVTAFRSAFGLPAYSAPTGSTPGFSVIHPNTAPGDCPTAANSCVGDLFENSLDVEWAGAIAPKASIILVASTNGTGSTYTSDPVYVSSDYIVQHNTAAIMNVSYGECELGLGTAGNTGYNNLWQTASAEGIAVFVASGDQGSASCDAGSPQHGPYGAQFGLSVSGVASTPYNTAVGGTDFNWSWKTGDQAKYWATSNNGTNKSSALGYIPENPWNSTCVNPFLVSAFNTANGLNHTATEWCDLLGTEQLGSNDPAQEQALLDLVNISGGSGGKSSCITGDQSSVASCTKGYTKPTWQTALTPHDNVRDIPDVSFFAANGFSGSAYIVCVSATGSCSYTAGAEPVGEEVGGTSVGSPIMAGIMALVNQKAGGSQGNPNTLLYQLAGTETFSSCSSETVKANSATCIFNDIDTGTISMPCDTSSPDCNGTDVGGYGILNGYSASAGYDLATGLGSLNVANFVNSFASSVAPAVTLTPTSLTFASTLVGSTAATKAITVKNTGNSDLSITGITVTGTNASSYSETHTCTSTLAAGSSCTVTVTFQPTTTGALTASVSIADDATGSPQTVSLTGTGTVPTSAVTLNPTSLTFAATVEGQTSAAQTITVTNSGSAPLIITGVTIGGANANSFAQTNTCATVAVSLTCTISVTFTPHTFGSFSASISIVDNASDSPQAVALTGTGTEIGSFTLTASTPASTAPGATATSTITATPMDSYTGTITLTCSVAPITNGKDIPTCSAPAPITIAAGAVTGTVTLGTTAPHTLARRGSGSSAQLNTTGWFGAGGAALACVLLFGVPARKRAWRSLLTVLIFIGVLGALSGCGGGGGGGTVTQQDPGTTPGAYTVTVTGTDAASVVQTTTFTFTVN
jgi:subtilase family serine protease